jgi:hypothetical protein
MSVSGSGKTAAKSIAATMHSSRMGLSKMSAIKVPSRPTSAISRPESALEAVFSPNSRKKSPSPTRDGEGASLYYTGGRKPGTSPDRSFVTPPATGTTTAAAATNQSGEDHFALSNDQDPFDLAIAAVASDFPLPQFRPSLASPADSTDPMTLLDWSWHRTLNRTHSQFLAQLRQKLAVSEVEAERICKNIHGIVINLRTGVTAWKSHRDQAAPEEDAILSALKAVLADSWCPKLLVVWRCALVYLPRN